MAGNTRVAIEDGKGNTLVETTVEGIEKTAKSLKERGKNATGSGKPLKTAFEEMEGEIRDAFEEWLAIEKEREELNNRVKVLLEPFKSSHEWKPALLKRVFREKRKAMRDREGFEVEQHQMELFADALGIGGGS